MWHPSACAIKRHVTFGGLVESEHRFFAPAVPPRTRLSSLAYAVSNCCRYAVAQRLGDLMEEFEYDENPLGYMQEAS